MLPLDLRTEVWFGLPDHLRGRFQALSQWNLAELKWRLSKRNDLTFDAIESLMLEYRRYVGLILKEPDIIHPMGGSVDIVWHEHIIDTLDYSSFCAKVAGRFIHHVPNRRTEMSDGSLRDTWRTLSKLYNNVPQDVWCLSDSHCGGKCSDINALNEGSSMLAL